MESSRDLRVTSITLLATSTFFGLGWLPVALVIFAFGAFTAPSMLLSIAEIATFAIPATMLVWVLRSKHRVPRAGSIVILDAAYVLIVIYHAAIGWLTPPYAPITPWLIAYHCLVISSLTTSTAFFLLPHNTASTQHNK